MRDAAFLCNVLVMKFFGQVETCLQCSELSLLKDSVSSLLILIAEGCAHVCVPIWLCKMNSFKNSHRDVQNTSMILCT